MKRLIIILLLSGCTTPNIEQVIEQAQKAAKDAQEEIKRQPTQRKVWKA